MVATESLPCNRGRGKENGKSQSGSGTTWRERRQGRERAPAFSQPRPGGQDGKLEGKVPSADCLVGQRTGGQVARPIMPSILLRFKRGNVLFISRGPVETWQPLDGSDPTGILVTSNCLLPPLSCGCSNSKRPEIDWKRKGKENPLFWASAAFVRLLGF